MTDFILLVTHDDGSARTADVIDAVRSVGGEVSSVDVANGIVEGRIQTMDVPRLERLACVARLVEGACYITRDPPPPPPPCTHGSGWDGGGHDRRLSLDTPGRALGSRSREATGRVAVRFPVARRPGVARPPSTGSSARTGRGFASTGATAGLTGRPAQATEGSRVIAPAVRALYVIVTAIGVAMAVRMSMSHRGAAWHWVPVVQVLSASVLAGLAALSACGLCRFPSVAYGCTTVAAMLLLWSLLSQRSFSAADSALALAACLTAGCAAECLSDQ